MTTLYDKILEAIEDARKHGFNSIDKSSHVAAGAVEEICKEERVRFAIEQLTEVGKSMMEQLNSEKSKASFFDSKIKELKSSLTQSKA